MIAPRNLVSVLAPEWQEPCSKLQHFLLQLRANLEPTKPTSHLGVGRRFRSFDQSCTADAFAVLAIFHSNQWSTTGPSKAVVCAVWKE